MNGWACSTSQTEQDTPHLDDLSREVTVTDPSHPFFGRKFPLAHPNAPGRKGNLILRLPNGQHRSIPRAATDYDGPVGRPSSLMLPLISVRTILPVARLVRLMLSAIGEVSDDPALLATAIDQPVSAVTNPELSDALGATGTPASARTGSASCGNDPSPSHPDVFHSPHSRASGRGGFE